MQFLKDGFQTVSILGSDMEAQFGTFTLMASRKNWKRSKIVRQGL